MKKILKTLLLTSGALILAGGAMFTIALAANGWDIKKIGNTKIENMRYTEAEESYITTIRLDFDTSDISVVVDETAKNITIDYPQKQNKKGKNLSKITVTETENAISIIERTSFNLFPTIYSDGSDVIVTLPANREYSLILETDTGDVDIQNYAGLNVVDVETNTGDVSLESLSAQQISIETDTGDVTLSNLLVEKTIEIEVDTGDVTIKNNVTAKAIEIDTDTGDVRGKESVLTAETISISTDTGDVQATLSGKQIDYSISVETDTGDSNVGNMQGGTKRLRVETDTGDITIIFTE